MSAVVAHSLQNVTVGDLTAMSVYLKAQAEKAAPAAAVQVRPSEQQAGAMLKQGARLYEKHCADCHGPDGAGVPRVYPPLPDNANLQSADASSTLRIILDGAQTVTTPRAPNKGSMPGYAAKMTDQQIADVTNYIRNAWGNAAPLVTADQVAKARRAK